MVREKIDISIVIPAYNEAKRLLVFLDYIIDYCNASKKVYEIIIVDDGSSDKTIEAVAPYRAQFNRLHTIRSEKNYGKGHAIKEGLLRSNGEVCLFLDADGSVLPDEIEKNIHYILEGDCDIFAGSRVLRGEEQVLDIKWYREAIGRIFSFFVHTLLFKTVRDTQCGFKMFRRDIVESLFSKSYSQGYCFDIEILYLAHKMGYKIKEGPISWHHVDGSKPNLITDSIKMFFSLLQIRRWHR